MATILITGGTGMIGRALTELLLSEGHEVIVLTRKIPRAVDKKERLTYACWNVPDQTIDADAIRKADHIIHLAGAGVADKRWSTKRKQEIIDSRTMSSALIVKSLTEIPNRVQTVISASAIGWYGADTSISRVNGFREEAPADTQFLGETCRLWEESIDPVTRAGKRLVIVRTGIVLSKEGGALAEFSKPLQAGIATVLGNGQQVISWIHIDDLCRIYLWAMENKEIKGVYNAVAPGPVTNKQLVIALAKQKRGNFYLAVPVPSFMLKILLGEMSIEVLKSATVSCDKIKKTGFAFTYDTINNALQQLVGVL